MVATVFEPLERLPFAGLAGLPMDPKSVEALFGAEKEAAQKVAEEGASLAREAGLVAEAVAREGSPVWNAMVELAEERDAELIVIGSRGLSGLKHVVLGSVAAAVARHSPRSVLIVHDR